VLQYGHRDESSSSSASDSDSDEDVFSRSAVAVCDIGMYFFAVGRERRVSLGGDQKLGGKSARGSLQVGCRTGEYMDHQDASVWVHHALSAVPFWRLICMSAFAGSMCVFCFMPVGNRVCGDIWFASVVKINRQRQP
jgi:hypothetical protein